jgi:hypothetical protein
MSQCVIGALAFSAVFSVVLLWACATRIAPAWEKAQGDPVRQWLLRLAGWAALVQLFGVVLFGFAEWLRPPFFNFCTGLPGWMLFCLLYSSSGFASLFFWAAGSVLGRTERGLSVNVAVLLLVLIAGALFALGVHSISSVSWNRFKPELEVLLVVGSGFVFLALFLAWGALIEKRAPSSGAVALVAPPAPSAPVARTSRVVVPDEPPSAVPVPRPRETARQPFVDSEHVFAVPPGETGVSS